jgi:hypothetical protein
MPNDVGVQRELSWRLGCSSVVYSSAPAASVVVWLAVLGGAGVLCWLPKILTLAKHIYEDATTDSHRRK